MAVERQTDRHATFVTLRDKQEEIRNRGNTSSVELLYSLVFKLRESMLLQLRLNNKPMTKITHELFLTFWREKKTARCETFTSASVVQFTKVTQWGVKNGHNPNHQNQVKQVQRYTETSQQQGGTDAGHAPRPGQEQQQGVMEGAEDESGDGQDESDQRGDQPGVQRQRRQEERHRCLAHGRCLKD